MSKELFLLVEADPVLTFCKDWQARYIAAKRAAYAFAEQHGSAGFFQGWNDDLVALVPASPVPDGWAIQRPRRMRDQPRMVPAKGDKGEPARQAITALPAFPKQHEVAEAIGHPMQVRWREPGHESSGFSAMGRRLHLVQLFWPAAEGPFLIMAPDAAAYVAEIRAENPGCIIEQGEWQIPDGLRVISEVRKDLLIAEAKVRAEEGGAAVSAGAAA